jgi:hypothetical protein
MCLGGTAVQQHSRDLNPVYRTPGLDCAVCFEGCVSNGPHSCPSGPGCPRGLLPAQACPGPAAHTASLSRQQASSMACPRGLSLPWLPGPDKGRRCAQPPGTRAASSSTSSLPGHLQRLFPQRRWRWREG